MALGDEAAECFDGVVVGAEELKVVGGCLTALGPGGDVVDVAGSG